MYLLFSNSRCSKSEIFSKWLVWECCMLAIFRSIHFKLRSLNIILRLHKKLLLQHIVLFWLIFCVMVTTKNFQTVCKFFAQKNCTGDPNVLKITDCVNIGLRSISGFILLITTPGLWNDCPWNLLELNRLCLQWKGHLFTLLHQQRRSGVNMTYFLVVNFSPTPLMLLA